ncbi:RNB domain-containing ribonuclease [Helicobacter macacae]|uniref:RNB domain-containing protein n=1 Tax=Helicobacter macacae MIT 99-5501 TaxID=1357400 RepID=V8C5W4_9HELI|nr:ribonuclease R family protein [Helicobacter macacae]ETD22759.1 hypothetical protein HMPREF2086_01558 [Helicobacter macacae MIT 99-5501]
MKEFLISLCLGTNEIPKKYSSIYEQIKSCGAIENHQSKKHHNFFKLHCKFGIFSVSKPKSSLTKSIFLQDITKRRNDIRLSIKNTPKSLENGEIVLALLAGKFVRVIKSLSSHSTKHVQKQNLIYLEKQKGKIIGINFQDGEISTLPFSQKSLEQLPYHCVFSYENIKPKINKIYGVLEESKVDEAIALFLADRKEEFSQEAKQLAQSFGDRVEPSLYTDLSGGLYGGEIGGKAGGKVFGRADLSKLDFITIDPSDAKDHDDAIYYDEKSKVLYVAIADVSEYVLPKTALDEEAKQRLFSLYFPHKCHPMLPQELSENLCSLKANELKLALVCEIHFCATSSRKITPKSTKIYEALITPKANVSYEYIDSLLDTLESAKKSSAIFKPLKSLANPRWILSFWHIASGLKNERLKKGFDFFTKERKMTLDKEGEIESIRTILPTRAHSLIEEAMLLANVSVAMSLDSALGGKGIYRTHNPPTKDRLHALFGEIAQLGYTIKKSRAKKPQNDYSKNIHSQIAHLQSLASTQKEKEIIDRLIIKSQKEARYDCSKNEHFGLGFEAYTHFTSPIRRYSDILAHRLVKLLLRSSGTLDISFAKNLSSLPNQKEILRHINFTLESIRIATPLLNEAERGIAKCEMCFKDRKYARSAQKWQGESIYIRIIDERFPAIGVVDFAESRKEANDKSSKAKSSETKSHTPHTQATRAVQQLALQRAPNSTLQEILQGARVFVRDSSLQKHATYLAQIAQVELGSARIYANILDISTQVDSTPRAKSTKKPKNKHKTTKKQSSQKHKKQIK